MKVINLNKFKNSQVVELDGNRYSVGAISVDMYLHDEELATLDKTVDPAERIVLILSILVKISTIPHEILTAQPISVLLALMQVVQGNDPTEGIDNVIPIEAGKVEEVIPNA